MYLLPTSNYLKRSLYINHPIARSLPPKLTVPINHKDRVMKELKDLGLSKFSLTRSESRYLPSIIHPDEHLGGAIYGHHKDGFAMLVATDRRIIFLDKKPLFINEDEVNYYVVSGVKLSRAGFGCTVTLHTRVKDYELQTLNYKSANIFVEYIESRSLEHANGKDIYHDQSG